MIPSRVSQMTALGADWWNDSGVPAELGEAVALGAVGGTSNPVIVSQAVKAQPALCNPIIDRLLAYLPPDRAAAVLGNGTLPESDDGAVLFSDISGFTPLTEAIIARYGPRQGGEQFTDRLNAVYDALINEVERFGGSTLTVPRGAPTPYPMWRIADLSS